MLFDAHEGDHAVAFKIDTSGAWKATIEPVSAARTWNGMAIIKGTGDDVFTVVPATAGLVAWQFEHTGKSSFIVDAFAADGQDNLVNAIGDYSREIQIPEGTYLMTVRSEGVWSVRLLE